jgi:SAM-dependent methyltransferase
LRSLVDKMPRLQRTDSPTRGGGDRVDARDPGLTVDELFVGGDLVLDLGCGDGSWLDTIGPRYRSAIGIDISRDGMDSRTGDAPSWRFIKADLGEGLPFENGIADAIRANQVIEHVRDPRALAVEAHRVLRPGGLLFLTTPNIRYVRHLVRLALFGRGPMTSAHVPGPSREWDDGHLHYFTPGDLRRIVFAAGFSSILVSGLIAPTGRLQVLRPIAATLSGYAPIREFLSGNTLLVARA